MARPNDRDRRGIEARKAANQRARDKAARREAAINDRVQQIYDDALKRIKTREGLPDVSALVATRRGL